MRKKSKKLAFSRKSDIKVSTTSNPYRMALDGYDRILDQSVERKRINLQTIEDVKNYVPRLSTPEIRKTVIAWYLFAKDQIENGTTLIPWKELIERVGSDSGDLELLRNSLPALAEDIEKRLNGEISPLPPGVQIKSSTNDVQETTAIRVRRVYGPRPKGEKAAS